jgi:hypothetical protein
MVRNYGQWILLSVLDRCKQGRDHVSQRVEWLYSRGDKVITCNRNGDIPFPTTQSRILPAQYSLFHHSSKRLRVSRPTTPPSGSFSLLADVLDGTGDGIREGSGEDAKVPSDETGDAGTLPSTAVCVPFFTPFPFSLLAALNVLPAALNVSRFPLPNLLHG